MEEAANNISKTNKKQETTKTEVQRQSLEVRTIPDQIATSLQHIVRQMDILTQTMSILEVRRPISFARAA
jgi:centriolar protein POC1